jgi:predicted acylesterase/phospholipase RssA
MIDTIVFSGGGPNGIAQVAVLQTLMDAGHFKISEFKHCYSTSSGSLFSTLIAFVPIPEISDYLIQRPWSKWMNNKSSVENITNGKGLCDALNFTTVIEPFFKAYDVPSDITFQQYYERFGVELNIFVTDVKTFQSVVLKRSTHPNFQVMLAAAMSAAIYPIFTPLPHEDTFYMDGGFSDNFPAKACFADGRDPNTTLAVSVVGMNEHAKDVVPEGGVDFFSFIGYRVMIRLQKHLENTDCAKQSKYFIEFPGRPVFSMELWDKFLDNDPSAKRQIYADGCETAQKFLNTLTT